MISKMIVLHALWRENGFLIWGEIDNTKGLKRRGRPKKVPGGTSHPFTASISDLIDAIRNICSSDDWEKHISVEKEWIIIPSGKYFPQASPWLPVEDVQYENKLGRWQIEGIVLPAPVFMENIVLNYDEDSMLESKGINVGYDWHYWILCNKFLLRLLCTQRFIPYMERDSNGHWRAFWYPILEDPEDRYIMNKLIEKMPPICCSIIKNADAPMEFDSPKRVLTSFIKTAIDQIIRKWLLDLPKVEAKAPVERKLLYCLHGEESRIDASEEELLELYQGLRKWAKPLIESKEDFRLCLKLHEPGEENGDWYLSFHLQSMDDPNLLIPARKVWQVGQDRVQFYGKVLNNPHKFLLENLGKAVNIYPLLERALYDPLPEGCFLSLDEAYLFLRQSSVNLYEQGIGIILPEWWRDKKKVGPRLRMRIRPISEENTRMGLNSLVKYDWQIAIGNQTIDYEDIKALAKSEYTLKKIGDSWVEINPVRINSILKWFEANRTGGVVFLREALNMLIDKSEEEFYFEIDGEEWIDTLLQGAAGLEAFTLLDIPREFVGKLRPYQVRGYSWLFFLRNLGFGACLADDMGLGKTVQLIAMLLYERQVLDIKSPTLLICPTSVVGNWQREAKKFAPSLRTFVYHGYDRPDTAQFKEIVKDTDLLITTYNLIYREKELFSSIDWTGIVLDEAQNIKNPFAKQTRAIKKLKGGYRIALTGTPIENRLRDLWSIMDFINPGYLGSWEDFRRKFSIPIEKYGDTQRAEQLRTLTRPFILRRLKNDPDVIRDLPEKQEIKVYCNLTREQVELYHAVVEDLMESLEKLEGMERKGTVLATLTKLKQICNHPSQYLEDGDYAYKRSGKLERLVEMLEEVLEEGDKAIIFTQYVKMGKIIQNCLREHFKCEVPFLHGGVSRKMRENMIKRFQREEGPPIFVLSLKAGGVGLNLTRANHVFHYDRWWNPAVEDQATDRVFRIGQDKNVQVHTFICSGTLEEKIDLLIQRKKDLAEKIITSGEGWLTELDNKTLKELLVLDNI